MKIRKGIVLMIDETTLNNILQKAINLTRECNIPISSNINPHISISKAETYWGICRYKNGLYSISVSSRLLETQDIKEVYNTIIHEVLHTCKGCGNHGPLWKKYADIINQKYDLNIKRSTSYLEKGAPEPNYKYIVKCSNPGCMKVYKRKNKSSIIKHPEKYACGICNSPLTHA